MNDIIIIGAGSFGKEVAWLIEDINKLDPKWNLLGYIDDDLNLKDTVINGHKVLGGLGLLDKFGEVSVAFGLGSPKSKSVIFNKIADNNISFPNLIHPSVIIAPYVSMGIGNIICANNIISVNVHIEDFVTINLACTIGHDVLLKNFVTVSPGASLSGYVKVGECVDVGTGTVIIQGLEIGENTMIGAGSAVVKNIPGNCTAVGVPAVPIKYHV